MKRLHVHVITVCGAPEGGEAHADGCCVPEPAVAKISGCIPVQGQASGCC